MQKITPFLWFDGKAEEAARFYVGLFKDSRVVEVSRAPAGGPTPAGSVMSVTFQLEGQQFHALNGGPMFKFNEAISLFVDCATQAEVDALWDGLGEGGQPLQCGWLKDRYGLCWQIVPSALGKMLRDPDPARSGRVMAAMMKMVKIDVAALTRAYQG